MTLYPYVVFHPHATVAAMSHILFGLALISASLQTAWALFAEQQLLGLPVIAVMFYVGWHNVKGGADHLQNPRGSTGAAETHQCVNGDRALHRVQQLCKVIGQTAPIESMACRCNDT
jgi:hypothetical protein